MNPDEYGICVTSGYPISFDKRRNAGTLEAEAIVYGFGGVTYARFVLGRNYRHTRNVREIVRDKAEAWIAADDELRREMTERDALKGGGVAKWWREHGVAP